MLKLVWEKIVIKAIDSKSGESLCFFVSCWGGYWLLNFTCARNNATHYSKNIKGNRDLNLYTVYCFTVQLLYYIVFLDMTCCSHSVPPPPSCRYSEKLIGTEGILYWGQPCNSLESQLSEGGGVERCLIEKCYRNWNKLWEFGSLWLMKTLPYLRCWNSA